MESLISRIDVALVREGVWPGAKGGLVTWYCPKCRARNTRKHRRCQRCSALRPRDISLGN